MKLWTPQWSIRSSKCSTHNHNRYLKRRSEESWINLWKMNLITWWHRQALWWGQPSLKLQITKRKLETKRRDQIQDGVKANFLSITLQQHQRELPNPSSNKRNHERPRWEFCRQPLDHRSIRPSLYSAVASCRRYWLIKSSSTYTVL